MECVESFFSQRFRTMSVESVFCPFRQTVTNTMAADSNILRLFILSLFFSPAKGSFRGFGEKSDLSLSNDAASKIVITLQHLNRHLRNNGIHSDRPFYVRDPASFYFLCTYRRCIPWNPENNFCHQGNAKGSPPHRVF